MKANKSSRLLSVVLAITIAFTMVFVGVDIVYAETKISDSLENDNIITGILSDYYTFSFDLKSGELTLGCIENTVEPTMSDLWKDLSASSLRDHFNDVKKISFVETFKPIGTNLFFMDCFMSAEEIIVSENNQYFSSQDGVLFNKDKTILYYYPMGKVGKCYEIPEGVTTVGDNLQSISPFEYTTYLNTIKIPKSVTTIYPNSFVNIQIGDGNSITEFIVDEDNPNYKSVDGVLFSKNGKKLITYPSNKPNARYSIPDGVENVGSKAFSLTRNLRDVLIPEGIKIIGKEAFYGMWGYGSEIKVPSTVSSIEEGAFRYFGTNGTPANIVSFSRNIKLKEFPAKAFSRCGELIINIPCDLKWNLDDTADNFTFQKMHEGEWKVLQEATSSSNGMKERTCSICGEKERKIIPAGLIPIDESHFPDKDFRDYIIYKYDSDKDGALSEEERARFRIFDVDKEGFEELRNIESLEGIEYFPELEELRCDYTKVKNVDLTSNTKLKEVQFKHTPLTGIKLGENNNLYYLHVDNTELTEIDTSGLPSLKYLNVGETNISDLTLLPELDWLLASGCNLVSLSFSDSYDASDFYEKNKDDWIVGEDGVLVDYRNQVVN